MRALLTILLVVALTIGAAGIFVWWRLSAMRVPASREIVQLTQEKRIALQRLRAENKFQPHDYPPLGYTGMHSTENLIRGNFAVDGAIDDILSRSKNELSARDVIKIFDRRYRAVRVLDTEDRDRVSDYHGEIWYQLGFKGSMGRIHGSWYQEHTPPGYGEPLPPGWKSPTEPRPIE